MADDEQSNIGIAEGEESAASTNEDSSTNRVFEPLGGKSEIVALGRSFLDGRVRINTITIDGQSPDGFSATFGSNSAIIVTGEGLEILDRWEIERQGQKPLVFSKKISHSDNLVILNAVNAVSGALQDGSLQDGENVGLGFFASSVGGHMRVLNLILKYKDGENQKQTAKAKKDIGGEGKDRSRLGPTGGPANLIMESMGTTIGGVASPFIPNPILINQNRNDLEAALKSGDKKAIEKAIAEAKRLGDTEGLRRALKLTRDSEQIRTINFAISEIGAPKVSRSTTSSYISQNLTTNAADSGDEEDETLTVSESAQSPASTAVEGGVTGTTEIRSEMAQKRETSTSGALEGSAAVISQNQSDVATQTGSQSLSGTVTSQTFGPSVASGQIRENITAVGQARQTEQSTTAESLSGKSPTEQRVQGPREVNVSGEINSSGLANDLSAKTNVSLDASVVAESVLGASGVIEDFPQEQAGQQVPTTARGTSKEQDSYVIPGQTSQPSGQQPASSQARDKASGKIDGIDKPQEPGASSKHAELSHTVSQSGIAPLGPNPPQTPPATGSRPDSLGPVMDKLNKNKVALGRKLGRGPNFSVQRISPALDKPSSLLGEREPEPEGALGTGEEPTVDTPRGEGGLKLSQILPPGEERQPAAPEMGEKAEQEQSADKVGTAPSKKEKEEDEEDKEVPENQEPAIPPAAAAALVSTGPQGAVAAKMLDTKLGKEVIGQAASKMWWWGFGFSSATFFLGLDFLAGAAIMDVYWWRHRSQPKLFPMKGWQKAITVFANVFPFIAVFLFIGLVMVVGCNWPIPKSNLLPTYRGTIIGAIIGDDCKYFDVSSITSPPGSTPANPATAGPNSAASNLPGSLAPTNGTNLGGAPPTPPH